MSLKTYLHSNQLDDKKLYAITGTIYLEDNDYYLPIFSLHSGANILKAIEAFKKLDKDEKGVRLYPLDDNSVVVYFGHLFDLNIIDENPKEIEVFLKRTWLLDSTNDIIWIILGETKFTY